MDLQHLDDEAFDREIRRRSREIAKQYEPPNPWDRVDPAVIARALPDEGPSPTKLALQSFGAVVILVIMLVFMACEIRDDVRLTIAGVETVGQLSNMHTTRRRRGVVYHYDLVYQNIVREVTTRTRYDDPSLVPVVYLPYNVQVYKIESFRDGRGAFLRRQMVDILPILVLHLFGGVGVCVFFFYACKESWLSFLGRRRPRIAAPPPVPILPPELPRALDAKGGGPETKT